MVYFILAPHSLCVKIGSTTGDPLHRLKTLQIGTPEPLLLLGTIDGGCKEERAIRRRFLLSEVRGEWVGLNEALRSYLREQFGDDADQWLQWLPNFHPYLWNFHPWPKGSNSTHFQMHVEGRFGKEDVA